MLAREGLVESRSQTLDGAGKGAAERAPAVDSGGPQAGLMPRAGGPVSSATLGAVVGKEGGRLPIHGGHGRRADCPGIGGYVICPPHSRPGVRMAGESLWLRGGMGKVVYRLGHGSTEVLCLRGSRGPGVLRLRQGGTSSDMVG